MKTKLECPYCGRSVIITDKKVWYWTPTITIKEICPECQEIPKEKNK